MVLNVTDTGTHESLHEASCFVASVENRQGEQIANLDQISEILRQEELSLDLGGTSTHLREIKSRDRSFLM